MKMFRGLSLICLATVCAIVLGCDSSSPSDATVSSATAGNSAATPVANTSGQTDSTAKTDGSAPAVPADDPQGTVSMDSRKPKNGEEVAVLDTGKGKIVVMFFPDKAPNTVKNFKTLIKKGFYNGTKFHRIVPGFMIQGGDPNTKSSDRSLWGQGGPGYSIKAEFNNVHHTTGILSMARSSDPDSAGSQFFIMVGDAPFLDHKYTAFGKVVSGQDVADAIVSQPAESELAVTPVTIKTITLQKWPIK